MFFGSDPKIKKNRKVVGEKNGFTLWSWDWNELGNSLGYFGSSEGVMADEVALKMPEAVIFEDGHLKVNYNMIGV